MKILRCLFIALWFAGLRALAAPSAAAEPPREILAAESVLETAAGVTREGFPDADAVWLRSATIVRYAPDGTGTEDFDVFAKALTEKGRRDLQTFSFAFNAVYGGVEIGRVVLYKPDGTAIETDLALHSREMIAPGQMESNIYDPNHKVLRVGVPGVEIGDVVRVVGRRRTDRARMADTWGDYTTFEGTDPLLDELYEVHEPRERPLAHKRLRGEIPGAVTYAAEETPEGTIHRWRVRNVPRFFEEPNMPAAHTVVQRLLLSTIPDWPTVSRWYWELSKPRLESVSPEMRAKVQELTAGAKDDTERLRALFFFAAQNIRYTGITTETVAPGYEPRDVSATFERRYGVCRDKAAVLVAMLRLAGFDAFPVLITAGPLMDEEVPLPWFNHAIVAVRRPDGTFDLMDPTDETTQELFPSHLSHCSYLVATPEGEPLRVSPVIPAERNLVKIETAARLTPEGGFHGVSTLRFEGINDNAYRRHFASIKPEERRRFFEGLVKRVLPGAALNDFELAPADLRDTSVPLSARLEFAAEDTLIAGGGVALPPTPWFGPSVGLVNFALGQTGLERRRFPLVIDAACGVRERFELDVSAALGEPLSLPTPPAIGDERVVWRSALSHDAGRLAGEGEFRLETVEFSPAQYLELKSALERIAFERRRRPIFRGAAADAPADRRAAPAPAAEPAADVEILERTVAYDLASAGEWTVTETVRKKPLTFAGLKENSELKFRFNSGWESVTLDYARVVGPDGAVREISAAELNLMDAAWVGSAPRYPASKILVASLPGVEIGSVIEYRVTRRLKDRVFFHAIESLRGFEPARRWTLRVTLPADLPLQRLETAGLPPAREESASEGRKTLKWSASDLAPIPREDAQPPRWALAPTIFFSHPDGAAAYARALEAALRAAAARAGEVAAVGREIAAAHADRAARRRAIRDVVARRIRAAGPALHEAPLSAISPAEVVWREGYGHSADRAVVLAALLEAAGEAPEFVLASSLRPADASLRRPLEAFQPTFFSAVLVRVPMEDGWLYLNDTDQYAALGATPSEGAPGLVTRTGAIETIEPPPALAQGNETEYALTIEPDGAAALRVRHVYRGAAHGTRARLYAEMTPEERRRHHQELVGEISPDAVAIGQLETDFSAHPGREEFAVRIPRYAVRDDPYFYLALPDAGGGLPRIRADARSTPLYWKDLARHRTRVTAVWPEEFSRVLLAPPDAEWESAGGGVWVRSASGPRSLTVWRMARRQPAVFPAEAYPDLLDAHRRLTHPRGRFLLLRAAE